MNDVQLPSYLNTIIRAVLTALGASLVSKGVIDEGTAETLAGSAIAVLTLVWALLAKRHAREALKEAVAAPAGRARL